MNVVLKYAAVAIAGAVVAVIVDRKVIKKNLDKAGDFIGETLNGLSNQYAELAEMAGPFLDRDQTVKVIEHQMFYISSFLESLDTMGFEISDDEAKIMHDGYDKLAAERKELLGE